MEPVLDLAGLERPALQDRMLSIAGLRDVAPPTPLVGGLVDLDSLALLYGPPGSGKSFVATDLSACVASGTPWHGRDAQKAMAIYVLAEGVSGQSLRYQAWLREHNVQEPTESELLVLPEPINLLSPSSVGEFADVATGAGAKLIVLDTLARCMVGGDESSAKDAGLAVEQLDVIRRRTGACVVVVHHTGKDARAGARGSSAFEAAADSVFRVSVGDQVMAIQCTKQKHHMLVKDIRLGMRSAHGSVVLDELEVRTADGLSDAERRTLSELAVLACEGPVQSRVLTRFGSAAQATVYRHLSRLVRLGMVLKVGTDKQPRYLVSELGALTLSGDSHAFV